MRDDFDLGLVSPLQRRDLHNNTGPSHSPRLYGSANWGNVEFDDTEVHHSPDADDIDDNAIFRRSWRMRAAQLLERISKKSPEMSPFIPGHLSKRIYPIDYFWSPLTSALRDNSTSPSSGRRSVVSNSTYYTTRSHSTGRTKSLPGNLKEDAEYARLLKSRQLWPVDPLLEQDWSGRGQHTEFEKHEQKLINELLEVQENLGTTRTAVVQSVKCRRILLARKTIMCGKRTMTKEEAVAEISHLTRLSHAHILRVIGTYVKGRELSILLYPVADCNLEVFLDRYREMRPYSDRWLGIAIFLERCASCLSSAVRYIHRNLTKHMDIKPQNILILATGPATYAPFIADFGIARSYEKLEDVETDGETSFTRRYAAPEVVKQESRGLPADIFSLGCVFFEIFASTYGNYVRDEDFIELGEILKSNPRGDTSYQANIDALQAQLSKIPDLPWSFSLLDPLSSLIKRMLRERPEQRPSAEDLVISLGERPCCVNGSVSLQALAKDRLGSNT